MRWPPYKHVFFDCDSTLTTVEGIDVLAAEAGKRWRVETLTRAAMDGDLELEDVYQKRLRALRPTRGQVKAIRQVYKQNMVPEAREVIAALQHLGHAVYIVSSGLAEPVIEFGLYLGVPRDRIRAVPVQYDELSGTWWIRDRSLPNTEKQYLGHEKGSLTVSAGKATVIRQFLQGKRGRAILFGDGASDLLAEDAVDLFVGFGGVVRRERIMESAPCYIQTPSLAPALALAAGPAMLATLPEGPLRQTGELSLELIESGAITFQDERLRTKFEQAYQAIHSGTHGGQAGNP